MGYNRCSTKSDVLVARKATTTTRLACELLCAWRSSQCIAFEFFPLKTDRIDVENCAQYLFSRDAPLPLGFYYAESTLNKNPLNFLEFLNEDSATTEIECWRIDHPLRK